MKRPHLPNKMKSMPAVAAVSMFVLLSAVYPLALQLVDNRAEHLADWLADGATATVAVIIALAVTEFYTRWENSKLTTKRLARLRREIELNLNRAHILNSWFKCDDRAAARIMTFPDYSWRAVRNHLREDLDDETLYLLESFYGRLRIVQNAESARIKLLREGANGESASATKHAMRNMVKQGEKTLAALPPADIYTVELAVRRKDQVEGKDNQNESGQDKAA